MPAHAQAFATQLEKALRDLLETAQDGVEYVMAMEVLDKVSDARRQAEHCWTFDQVRNAEIAAEDKFGRSDERLCYVTSRTLVWASGQVLEFCMAKGGRWRHTPAEEWTKKDVAEFLAREAAKREPLVQPTPEQLDTIRNVIPGQDEGAPEVTPEALAVDGDEKPSTLMTGAFPANTLPPPGGPCAGCGKPIAQDANTTITTRPGGAYQDEWHMACLPKRPGADEQIADAQERATKATAEKVKQLLDDCRDCKPFPARHNAELKSKQTGKPVGDPSCELCFDPVKKGDLAVRATKKSSRRMHAACVAKELEK